MSRPISAEMEQRCWHMKPDFNHDKGAIIGIICRFQRLKGRRRVAFPPPNLHIQMYAVHLHVEHTLLNLFGNIVGPLIFHRIVRVDVLMCKAGTSPSSPPPRNSATNVK